MCADSIILRLQRDWRLAGRLAGFDRHWCLFAPTCLYVAVVILGDPFKYEGVSASSESVNDLIAIRATYCQKTEILVEKKRYRFHLIIYYLVIVYY